MWSLETDTYYTSADEKVNYVVENIKPGSIILLHPMYDQTGGAMQAIEDILRELTYIFVKRHPNDQYRGKCPFHQDCLEGLASGPAIEERWGQKGIELLDRAEVWEMEGYYLAQAIMQYLYILSPQRIIIGGGVMNQKLIFTYIHKFLLEFVNNYVELPKLSDYIVSPGLGNDAGVVGALILARYARDESF